MMPCPCCGIVVTEDEIVPDGVYLFGERSLVLWKCKCGTNRAARFEHVSPALRRAAMLADLALRPDSPERKGSG